MKVAIYLQEKLYKEVDLGEGVTSYKVPNMLKLVDADRKAGLLTGFDLTKSLDARFVPVK